MDRMKKWLPEMELMIALLITAGISIGFFIIKSGGFFVVVDDFNSQQLTFTTAVQEALAQNPKGEWFWGLDLGASLINGFSFYNLGSVFFWIAFLLPKGTFPYVCGFLYILKYIVAGIAAFYYLKFFVDNKRYAVIGAVAYAFSGFQTINLEFFHFHDVVAWFPVLLLALELAMKDRKYGPLFIAAVFLNCITNYFFFIQEVIFLIIYFLFRYWGMPKAALCKELVRFMTYGVIGVGMASVLFVPSILYVLGSARTENSLLSLSQLFFDRRGMLFVLKGMLFPADAMNQMSALKPEEYSSTSCYLPLFGMSFVISFLRYDRGWLKKLLLFLLAISFSPLIQSAFNLFAYLSQRWWYMLVLLLALATINALENYDRKQLSRGIIGYLVISTGFYLCLLGIEQFVAASPVIFHPLRLLLYYLIVVSSSLCLLLIVNMTRSQAYKIVAVLMVFSISTTAVTLHYYRTGTNQNEVEQSYAAGLSVPHMDDQYRYHSTYNYYTLENNNSGIGGFSSTIENSSRQFDTLFEIHSINSSQFRSMCARGLPQLLAGKYIISRSSDGLVIDNYKANQNTYSVCKPNESNTAGVFEADGIRYSIIEEKACPIGFSVNRYMMKDDLLALPVDERAPALMQAALIDEGDETRMDGFATRMDTRELMNSDQLDSIIEKTVDHAVNSFHRDATGFTCKTKDRGDRLVYWSVPNDRGWKATIDGEDAEILNSGGMVLLKVPAGNHTITFKYHTPGFRIGIILTILFWILYLLYTIPVLVRSCRNRNGR